MSMLSDEHTPWKSEEDIPALVFSGVSLNTEKRTDRQEDKCIPKYPIGANKFAFSHFNDQFDVVMLYVMLYVIGIKDANLWFIK